MIENNQSTVSKNNLLTIIRIENTRSTQLSVIKMKAVNNSCLLFNQKQFFENS